MKPDTRNTIQSPSRKWFGRIGANYWRVRRASSEFASRPDGRVNGLEENEWDRRNIANIQGGLYISHIDVSTGYSFEALTGVIRKALKVCEGSTRTFAGKSTSK